MHQNGRSPADLRFTRFRSTGSNDYMRPSTGKGLSSMKADAAVASRYNSYTSVLTRDLVPAHVAFASGSSVTPDAVRVRPNKTFVFQAIRHVIDKLSIMWSTFGQTVQKCNQVDLFDC